MLEEAAVKALITAAGCVREQAYAPYSGLKVGAAVVAEDDRVFFGANIENASYGLSLCAERAAISGAVANGAKRIRAIIILTDTDPPAMPCGACRQWLAEFGDDSLEVITANPNGCIRRSTLGGLLPQAFRLTLDN